MLVARPRVILCRLSPVFPTSIDCSATNMLWTWVEDTLSIPHSYPEPARERLTNSNFAMPPWMIYRWCSNSMINDGPPASSLVQLTKYGGAISLRPGAPHWRAQPRIFRRYFLPVG